MSGPQSNQTPNHGQAHQAECDAILEQVEAYALGALDRFDAGIVEQHLRWCPRCRDEVEAVSRVVSLLPFAVSSADPPTADVKSRLLARIASDNQSDPYETSAPQRPDVPGTSQPSSGMPQEPVTGARPGTTEPTNGSWLRFVPPAIVAPLAIVLLVLGAWANSMRLELEEQERVQAISSQEALDLIVANGGSVQLYSMEPMCTDCPGRGRLGVDVADDVGVVVAWGLNPDQEHEVWCVNKKGDRQMVSKLDVDAEGGVMQAFSFPETMSEYSEVYIAQADGGAMYMTHLDTVDSSEQTGTPGD